MIHNQGKTLTIFLVVISILLLSLTAITIFFFQKENEMRNALEFKLAEQKAQSENLVEEKNNFKKQIDLLEEKVKESDERINSLMDDLELEEGLREQVKQENTALKEQMAQLQTTNKKLQDQLKQAQDRIDQLETDLRNEQAASRAQAEKTISAQTLEGERITPTVQSNTDLEGTILSVRTDDNFVIFDLGSINGITEDMIMSVYRGGQYLGDIKVTRVQTRMSVADFIPPLSSDSVEENDKVILKK